MRGVWQPQADVLFDIHVIDTDAQSHAHHSVNAVLAMALKEKKRKYTQAAQACHASFSPFVLTVNSLMAREACFVMQWIDRALSTKWSKSYGVVVGWVKTRMSIAFLRATNLCVRGSRVKWRSGQAWKTGQGLP